jgi:hypothetical protein
MKGTPTDNCVGVPFMGTLRSTLLPRFWEYLSGRCEYFLYLQIAHLPSTF